MDELNTDSGTSSTTPSTENSQKQAQNSFCGRLDGLDDVFPTNETSQEKYDREQEEQKTWGKGLE